MAALRSQVVCMFHSGSKYVIGGLICHKKLTYSYFILAQENFCEPWTIKGLTWIINKEDRVRGITLWSHIQSFQWGKSLRGQEYPLCYYSKQTKMTGTPKYGRTDMSGVEGEVGDEWPLSPSLFTSCQSANKSKVAQGGTWPRSSQSMKVGEVYCM